MPVRDPRDPFPNDRRAKKPHRVKRGRHYHIHEDIHYRPGDVVLLAPERVKSDGISHLVEPLGLESVPGSPVADVSETRAVVSSPMRARRAP